MMKTTAILSMAALAAVAMVPAAQADNTAHSWLDVAFGFDFGQGAGLYDPDPVSPNYCAAYTEFYVGVSPVLLYHVAGRYWLPSVGAAEVPVGLYQADPTNCGTLVPGSGLAVDYATFNAGGAFYSWNLLGATQVAALGSADTWVGTRVCSSAPSTTAGVPADNGVDVAPVGAFLAESLQCGGGFTALNKVFPGCKPLPASTVVGEFNLDNPVFTSANADSCNSVQNTPALGTDYAVLHCVSVQPFDTVLGLLAAEKDQDHFVVFNGGNPVTGGSLAAFALAPGTPPGGLFPNVSNFADDSGATSGLGC